MELIIDILVHVVLGYTGAWVLKTLKRSKSKTKEYFQANMQKSISIGAVVVFSLSTLFFIIYQKIMS